jgi:hypothetical protein
MTTSAIVGGFRICQARLGAKIHGHKDPSSDLGPMFRQVVGTTFQLMEEFQDFWLNVKGSKDVPSLGKAAGQDAPPFEIDHANLIDYFKIGWSNFGGVWKNIIKEQDLQVIGDLALVEDSDAFHLPIETWVRIVYRYACFFHRTQRQRFKIIDTMIPLYYARVASLVNELKDKDQDAAEAHFEANAQTFERLKGYMADLWIQGEGE